MENYSSESEVLMVLHSMDRSMNILLGGQFELGIPHALKNKLYVLKTEIEDVLKLVSFHYVQEPVKGE